MSQNFKVKNGLDVNGVQIIAANGQLTGPAATQITNLVGNSSSPDTWVRNAANSASSYANSAYSRANTAITNASTASDDARSAGSYANSALSLANTHISGITLGAGGLLNTTYNILMSTTSNTTVSSAKTNSNLIYVNNTLQLPNGAVSVFTGGGNGGYTSSVLVETNRVTVAGSSQPVNEGIRGESKYGPNYITNMVSLGNIVDPSGASQLQLSNKDEYSFFANTTNDTTYYLAAQNINSPNTTLDFGNSLYFYNGEVTVVETDIIAQSHGTPGTGTIDGIKYWKLKSLINCQNNTLTITNIVSETSNSGNSGTWTASIAGGPTGSAGGFVGIQIQGESGKNIMWMARIQRISLIRIPLAAAGGGGGGK